MDFVLSKSAELVVGCMVVSVVAISTLVPSIAVGISHNAWVTLMSTAIVGVVIFGGEESLQESVFVSWSIGLVAVVMSWITAWILAYIVPSYAVQAVMMRFMELTSGSGQHLDPLPAQRTIRNFRIVLHVGYCGLAMWNIIITDSLLYTLASTVRLAVLMPMYDVAGLNDCLVRKTIITAACLVSCLYCEALALQYSANLGLLDEPVIGIVNRSDGTSEQDRLDVGWTRANKLALAGVLATIVAVFLSATLNTWLQRWQLARSKPHGNRRIDVEAGNGADTYLRETLERQAVAHLANNSSNESFFSAAQEFEELQPIDETVFYGDNIAMPMSPPIAHLRL